MHTGAGEELPSNVGMERVKTKDKEKREKGRRWCGLRSGPLPVKTHQSVGGPINF